MFPRGVTSSPSPISAHRQTPPHFHPDNNMGPPTERKAILEKLRKSIKDGSILVGAGAGIGLSAKFIEAGGGDMIIIYNSGRFRMAGRGSLAGLMPYGNANDVVIEMERLPFPPARLYHANPA
jgi:predicted TIM-barrel enzyme